MTCIILLSFLNIVLYFTGLHIVLKTMIPSLAIKLKHIMSFLKK